MSAIDTLKQMIGIGRRKSISGAMPFVNEPTGLYPQIHGAPPEVDYNTLWMYFKMSPEVIALVTAIVEDILSDGWDLEGDQAAVEKAEKWLFDNHTKETFQSFLFDAFVTGDAYLFKNKLSKMEVKSVLEKALKGYDLKSKDGKKIWEDLKNDEDIFSTRSFTYVPSSTMRLQYNPQGGDIIKYVQTVQGMPTKDFTPDEIIHFKLMTLDGKMYGFSPLRSITRELDILLNVKDYTRYYFEKGGVPNFLFILKNTSPEQDFYKQFKKSLVEYSNLTQRYKSMVVCGEVEAQELSHLDKDMEFRELARYITQIMVMTWGVPANRLSDALVQSGMKSSVTSSEGYYRKISHYQDILEDLINSQLLNDRNVKLAFRRTYKQDEVRTTQIDKIKSDVCEQRLRLALVDRDWCRKYLNVPHKNFPDESKVKEQMEQYKKPSGFSQQSQLNKHQVLSESEKLAEDKQKQESAIKE